MHSLSVVETCPEPALAAPQYLALGATLYMPATRSDLDRIFLQEKLPGLRSLVACTEDAIRDNELAAALTNLGYALERLRPRPLLRFVRPRDPATLEKIIRLPGCERLDGFVLPKVTPGRLLAYADIAARHPHLALLPTIETDLAFDRRQLDWLLRALERVTNPVLCLRIGGNDLLNLLGIKRPKELTLYDTPLRRVIDDIILTFRPAGYDIAAPVFEHVDSPDTLAREVRLDVVHGLLAKTAIHPVQIPLIENLYCVSRQEHDVAERILAPDAAAVFQYGGQMCEPATHRRWAERLLLRSQLYGVC